MQRLLINLIVVLFLLPSTGVTQIKLLDDFERYEVSYQKELPLGKPLPINFETALVEISIDKKYDDNKTRIRHFSYDSSHVKASLAEHVVVRRTNWANVNPMRNLELEGWIYLEDGTPLQFLIRPGGTAKVIYPDGGVVYLLQPSVSWQREKI